MDIEQLLIAALAEVQECMATLKEAYAQISKQYGKEHALTRTASNTYWNAEMTESSIKELTELTLLRK